jgi:hypothetical protein
MLSLSGEYNSTNTAKLAEPRVEAGQNTSTAVPANRKRRQKGNTVSDETVKCGYWASVT